MLKVILILLFIMVQVVTSFSASKSPIPGTYPLGETPSNKNPVKVTSTSPRSRPKIRKSPRIAMPPDSIIKNAQGILPGADLISSPLREDIETFDEDKLAKDFQENFGNMVQKTYPNAYMDEDEKDALASGRIAFQRNLQELAEYMKSNNIPRGGGAGALEEPLREATAMEFLQAEEKRLALDNAAYARTSDVDMGSLESTPKASSQALIAATEALAIQANDKGETLIFNGFAELNTPFDDQALAYERLVKALDGGPPEHDGPFCPVCMRPASDRELKDYGKCMLCRGDDLTEPNIPLELRYKYFKYDDEYAKAKALADRLDQEEAAAASISAGVKNKKMQPKKGSKGPFAAATTTATEAVAMPGAEGYLHYEGELQALRARVEELEKLEELHRREAEYFGEKIADLEKFKLFASDAIEKALIETAKVVDRLDSVIRERGL